jgi:sialate O-acetylesterase
MNDYTMNYFKALIFFFSMVTINANLIADLKPASILGDNMILQKGMPVPIWGKAKAKEEIIVRFAGHELKTTSDRSGKWKVELPPLKASFEERELTIQGKEKVTFKGVLVGEVWICSGQSNMQYGWGKSTPFEMYKWGGDETVASWVPKMKEMAIRSFHVEVDASFSPKDNCKGSWHKGPSGSAVAFGFSYQLQQSLNVPVGVIVTCWGSSSIEGWMPLELTKKLPHFEKQMQELLKIDSVMRVNNAIKMGVRPGFVWLRKRPNLLFNAMLNPLIPYACRGLVWYQGEANANQPKQYGVSLPLWVQELRKKWTREDLHVLAVMLPGYGKDNGHPNSKSWAWFREAQLKSKQLSCFDVVNTIDLGDAANIHPSDKAPIAQRLSLLARQKVYGEKGVGIGPIFEKSRVDGQKIVITFNNAKGLKTTDGKSPKSFWVSDGEKNWFEARAVIEGESVVLVSEKVLKPTACRYAFSGKPDLNLVNDLGLPAYPFRTDDWSL